MSEPIRVLSLGAGVQSSTLALMFARGAIPQPPPESAIFADTRDEPEAVYRWLDWLEGQLPFPVHRVGHKTSLSEMATRLKRSKKSGNTYLAPALPVHLENLSGKKGMSPRQCTREFKIDPINRELRRLAQPKRGARNVAAVVYIGISTDEAMRMKPSPKTWVEHQWPLIDNGMSRQDCIDWMVGSGYPEPPRSACVYCPYHSNAEWSHLKAHDPEGFQAAVDFELRLQHAYSEATALQSTPFLHASLQSLAEVDFDAAAPDSRQMNLFNNECEGLCGV